MITTWRAAIAAACAALLCSLAVAVDVASESAAGRVVELQGSNFDQLIRAPGRPYHSIVLLTARDPRFKCEVCSYVEGELRTAAAAYAGRKDKSEGDTPVLFAVADVNKNRPTFSSYKINSVPMLLHFAPTDEDRHSRTALPRGMLAGNSMTGEAIQAFTTANTGAEFEIYRSPLFRILGVLAFFGVVGYILTTYPEQLWAMFIFFRSKTWIWGLGCVFLYFISISGALYNVIRDVPSFGASADRKSLTVFHSSNGTQYAMEGYIIGFMNVVAAGAILLLIVLSKRFKGDKLLTLTLSTVGVFVFFYFNIIQLYRMKNAWIWNIQW